MRLISVGDNVADCYLNKGIYYPGGNCVNVAVNAKRNGFEKVEYIGVLGTDYKAQHIKNCLKLENIIIDRCRVLEGISGSPGVNIDKNGDRIFVGGPKDTVQHRVSIRLTKEEINSLKDYDLLHTSCYSNIDYCLKDIKNNIAVSYDFSNENLIEKIKLFSEYIDFAFLSGGDLSKDDINKIISIALEKGVKLICITLGSNGSFCADKNNIYKTNAVKTDIVDTMGAGDSYIAAFLYNYIKTKNIKESMDYASLKASYTCRIEGGFGYPAKLK